MNSLTDGLLESFRIQIEAAPLDDDPLGFHFLFFGVQRTFAHQGEFRARREHGVGQAGSLVTPRLTHFDSPFFAFGIHHQHPMRITQGRLLDNADQLESTVLGPAPAMVSLA